MNGGTFKTIGSASHGIAAASLAGGQLGTSGTETRKAGAVLVASGEGVSVETKGPKSHGVWPGLGKVVWSG